MQTKLKPGRHPTTEINRPIINLNHAALLYCMDNDVERKKETKIEKKDEFGNTTEEKTIEEEEKED